MDDDKDTTGVSANGGARQAGMVYAMRTEAETVLGDSVFHRSPIIAKLLRFLIEETLAGKAHLLKSYTVAVDGLGRPADFDVGDSYARVQMGRLRKMLQSHYAEHGPVDDLCIYLQRGSYVVKLGRLVTAYPTLYRPLSAAAPPTDRAAEPSTTPNLAVRSGIGFRLRGWHAGIVVGILITAILGMLWRSDRFAESVPLSPILELEPVDVGKGEDAAKLARVIESSFELGLPRFKISRVRLIKSEPPDAYSKSERLVYRMHSQVEARDEGASTLFLRLTDIRSDTLIWSREVSIPPEPGSIEDAIAPLLAEIVGPHGVIATQSAIAYKDDNRGGYPCLMKYFSFFKTRDVGMEKLVSACFEKPVKEPRIRATILAARALFALESQTVRNDPSAGLARARDFANQALAADANDASARFAMARIAYIEGDCMSARFYTQQTVDANSYSPVFMAGLAGHAPQCRYEKSGELLDRAFLVANPGDTDARLLLVIAAVAQGRADRVDELQHIDIPRDGRHRLNYYLSESIIAASEKRNSDAVMYWQQFSRMLGAEKMSPDKTLQRLIRSPVLRRQVVVYLESRGVFADRSVRVDLTRRRAN